MLCSMMSLTTYCQEEPETSVLVDTSADTTPEEAAATEETATQENPSDTAAEEASAEQNQETEVATDENVVAGAKDLGPVENSEENATPAETTEQPTEPVQQEVTEETQNSSEDATPQEDTIPEQPVIEEEPEKINIPEEAPAIEEEPVGIDTVSLENPQGNWLFKRIWWERAEERYEKIRLLVDSIWESRNTFFYERNQLDRTVLDPFYMNVGIDRGELQTILSEIGEFLEKHRDQEQLSEQEQILASEEETLKQLKRDIDMITSLDQAIDDALGTFMNQINRVRNYEGEAWKNFREIARILNDTRARELYYMIEGSARNIKTISTYLEQEFFTHFHKLVDETKARVARVQNQMDALKEKGVLFQKQAEQIVQQVAQEEAEEEQQEVKPKPKLGWFDSISSGISSVFEYVWSIIRLPYDLIFGK